MAEVQSLSAVSDLQVQRWDPSILSSISAFVEVSIKDGSAYKSKKLPLNEFISWVIGLDDTDKSQYVHIATDETITGGKTFTKAISCNVVPTSDADLTNKKYVDGQVDGLNADLSELKAAVNKLNIDLKALSTTVSKIGSEDWKFTPFSGSNAVKKTVAIWTS